MTKPTLQEVLPLTPEADKLLRQAATRVLDPGPWEHDLPTAKEWECPRCGEELGEHPSAGYTGRIKATSCPVPPTAEGSWADIAEKLLACLDQDIDGYSKLRQVLSQRYEVGTAELQFELWVQLSARERVICLLMALKEIWS
jgi:hypothetical protein